jgi:hypothetical protein
MGSSLRLYGRVARANPDRLSTAFNSASSGALTAISRPPSGTTQAVRVQEQPAQTVLVPPISRLNPASPYLSSPARGWPTWAACTRIWWVRPVAMPRLQQRGRLEQAHRIESGSGPACRPSRHFDHPLAARAARCGAGARFTSRGPMVPVAAKPAPDSVFRPARPATPPGSAFAARRRSGPMRQTAAGLAIQAGAPAPETARRAACARNATRSPRSPGRCPCAPPSPAGLSSTRQLAILVQHRVAEPLGQRRAAAAPAAPSRSPSRTGGIRSRSPVCSRRRSGWTRPPFNRTSPLRRMR